MVCDINNGLNEESNFDRESIDRNMILNNNVPEHYFIICKTRKISYGTKCY